MARMQRQTHIAYWLRMSAENELALGRSAKKLFKAQGKSAKNAYENNASIPAVVEAVANGNTQWKRVLIAHYTTTIKTLSQYTSLEMTGKKAAFLPMFQKQNFQTRVQNFITTQGLAKSKLITETTIDKAKAIISNGTQNGHSQDQIAQALQEGIGGAVADSRARTIARTEVHNASTYAMQETAEEIGEKNSLSVTKEWVAVDDDRTREWHAEVDGQEVDIDDTFTVDDEDIDRPGEGSAENAINCRCSLMYHTTAAGGDETESDDDANDDVGEGGYLS
jgi:SPP1 gp7 family putative phage head morphogenesis protein